MSRHLIRPAFVVTFVALAAVVTAQAPAAPGAPPAAVAPVRVPEGNGTPVVTDGIFTPGEWDDATAIAAGQGIELRVKQVRGVVFIGVRGQGTTSVGPSELFLAAPGGPIQVLHVSYQLGEIVLPSAGERPPFRFGLTSGWYANEFRRDMELSARLQKEGKPPIEVIRATSYPSDGIEFAIRRAKLPGSTWLMRAAISALVAGTPSMVVYPAAAAETATAGWLELTLD